MEEMLQLEQQQQELLIQVAAVVDLIIHLVALEVQALLFFLCRQHIILVQLQVHQP